MTRGRQWTRGEVEQLYALYRWSTMQEIADMLSLSRERIRQLFQKFGFEHRHTAGRRLESWTTDARLALRVRTLHEEHPTWSIRQLAQRLFTPSNQVRYHATRLGLTCPPSHQGRDPWSDAEMLALLRVHATRPARWWISHAADMGYPGVTSYQLRFGSWNTARARAGLPTAPVGRPKKP